MTKHFDPRWLTKTVIDLAQSIYSEGPSAFPRLPILGDALLDAACDDEELIGWCQACEPRALIGILWHLKTTSGNYRFKARFIDQDGTKWTGQIERDANRWLDADPSLCCVRGMLAEWYWQMGLVVEAEANEWLWAGEKWPDEMGWAWGDVDNSKDYPGRNSLDCPAHSTLPLGDIGNFVRVFDANRFTNPSIASRQNQESCFVDLWRNYSNPQRRCLWQAIGMERPARFDQLGANLS